MTTPSPPWFHVKLTGDEVVVVFRAGQILDGQTIQPIFDELVKLVNELGHRHIVLDFKEVEYMSSAALGKLIMLKKKVNAAGGQLTLRMGPPIDEARSE